MHMDADVYVHMDVCMCICAFGKITITDLSSLYCLLHYIIIVLSLYYIIIDLANNKLKKIEGIGALTQLKKIDLGANRIRVMDGNELGGLVNLEELWIGKNKIEEIGGLEKVSSTVRTGSAMSCHGMSCPSTPSDTSAHHMRCLLLYILYYIYS
jgi:hypothetical protein